MIGPALLLFIDSQAPELSFPKDQLDHSIYRAAAILFITPPHKNTYRKYCVNSQNILNIQPNRVLFMYPF